MMAKPMKTLELHYPMIQFLIIGDISFAFLRYMPFAEYGIGQNGDFKNQSSIFDSQVSMSASKTTLSGARRINLEI